MEIAFPAAVYRAIMPSPFISVIKEAIIIIIIIITPDLRLAAVAKNGFDVLVVRIPKNLGIR